MDGMEVFVLLNPSVQCSLITPALFTFCERCVGAYKSHHRSEAHSESVV
jgi:hypothetical protein